jgi:hypothetical protein
MASILMARGLWEEGAEAAVAAARLGAGGELLVELTGRLGREGRDRDIARIAHAAGGWERFLSAPAHLRVNLATALERCGEQEAARALWSSLHEDALAHPDLRLRARRALSGAGFAGEGPAAPGEQGAKLGRVERGRYRR